jgi:hypothetical protein
MLGYSTEMFIHVLLLMVLASAVQQTRTVKQRSTQAAPLAPWPAEGSWAKARSMP